MSRLRMGVVRYASAGAAIARALGMTPPPDCRIGQGRIVLTFRGIGASRWPMAKQVEYALDVAAVARRVLAEDSRKTVRRRASDRAIVIVFEDATIVRGCSVIARWECVVPADSTPET